MLRHELEKVRTLRANRVGAVAVVVLSALLAYLTARAMATAPDPTGAFAGATELSQVVLRTSAPALVLAAVLGVCAVRAELRDGVLRLALLRRPGRGRLLATKAACVALVGGLVGAASAAAALGAVALAHPDALPATVWVAGIGAHAALAAGWAVAGLCAGVLVPHLAGAVASVVALPLVVEPALSGLLGGGAATDLLPFRAGASVYAWLGETDAFVAPTLLHGPLTVAPFLVLLGLGLVASRARFARMDT